MNWRVEWTEGAIDSVERLDRRTRERMVRAVERLADIGHGDVRRVQGSGGELAFRVGSWRVFFVYVPAEQLIRVLRVRPRGSAYRL